MQGIHNTAYSPMGSPQSTEYFKGYSPKLVLEEPLVHQLAKKYNKNAGQVMKPVSCTMKIVAVHVQ